MANATSTQLQELYVAYFGRAADPTGLDYWTEKGITTAKFAADMYAQAEYKDAYGSLSTESQVNQIYKNLFDREADVTGLTYWTQEINLGNIKLAEIANHLIWAAQNNSGSSDDKTALTNRTNAAVAYTAKVKESTAAILSYQAESTDPWASGVNITEAISYLSGIDKDTAHTAAGIAASVTTITNNGTPSTAKTITLTTGTNTGDAFTGGAGADTFNADLSATGTNTLNALDQIDGGSATDTLNAVLAANVTPKSIKNVERIVATGSGAARTLNLVNSSSETYVENNSTTDGILTVSNIAAGADLGVKSTALGTTFSYTTTSGTQSVNLSVDGVTGGTSTKVEVDGIETIAVTLDGADSAWELYADAATALTFAGSAASTVTYDGVLAVSHFDASSTTGGFTTTLLNNSELAATTDVTVTGGSGNDAITTTAHTQSDLNLVGGAGNDTFTNTAYALVDTIDGGTGTDTLNTTTAVANTLDASTSSNITNTEIISLSTAFDGTLAMASIASSLNEVTLALSNSSTAALFTGSDDTITGPAGSLTVNLGASAAGSDTAASGGLTIGDTGTATDDSLTINNKMVNSTTGANVNVTAAQSFTSSGYENITYDSGSGTGNVENTFHTITITGDDDSKAQSITFTGTNGIDIVTSLTSNSSGLLTVDASGMTAQASGTTTFDIGATSHATNGTASITGSPGEDIIAIGNFASTVIGGGEDDSITGGTAADNLQGGAANDTISGGGGNDTILGGAGNDTITSGSGTKQSIDGGAGNDSINMDASLSLNDTVIGGSGTDTLIIDTSAATAASSQGVSGFETLRIDTASLTQDMVQFTTNSTFTKVISNATGAHTISNVGAGVTAYSLLNGATTVSFARLLDNSSNELTVSAFTDTASTITSLTIDNEETITIDDGAINSAIGLTVTTLHAEDVVTLNITGVANVAISNAIESQATAALTTVDASGNTGTVSVNAGNASLALTMTGPSAAAATLAGGSGADTITTGSAADVITGNAGSDTITTKGGTDSITAGSGADTITSGEGADTVSGGSGSDSIILTENTSAADLIKITTAYGSSSDSERNTVTGDDNDTGDDTITGFTWGTDVIQVRSTGVVNFVHGTDTSIGTATGDKNDGTVGGFLKTVGLIDDNTTNDDYDDGGDVAITFASPSATLTETRFEAALQYEIDGSSAANTITGGALADTIDGGGGIDVLNGGDGNDVFQYDTVTDSGVNNAAAARTSFDTVTVAAGDIFDYTTSDIAAVVSAEKAEGSAVDANGADLITTLDAAFKSVDDGIANVEAAVVAYTTGEQFLVIDVDTNQTVTVADIIIELSGTVTGLTLSTGGDAVIA